MVALIAIFGTILGGGVLAIVFRKPKPKQMNVSEVRAMEMAIWGEYFTPDPKAIPTPPKGPGGSSKQTPSLFQNEVVLENNGRYYRGHYPSDAPANAHAELMLGDSYVQPYHGNYIVFKWTDQATGRTMAVKVPALEVDRHDIMVWGQREPVRTYYSGRGIPADGGIYS